MNHFLVLKVPTSSCTRTCVEQVDISFLIHQCSASSFHHHHQLWHSSHHHHLHHHHHHHADNFEQVTPCLLLYQGLEVCLISDDEVNTNHRLLCYPSSYRDPPTQHCHPHNHHHHHHTKGWTKWRPGSKCSFSCLVPARGLQMVTRRFASSNTDDGAAE